MLTFPVIVTAILEHHRTIRGGKDTLGQAFTEQVNMGWFVHLELPDGEPFGVALGIGTEKPTEFVEGDVLELSLRKARKD